MQTIEIIRKHRFAAIGARHEKDGTLHVVLACMADNCGLFCSMKTYPPKSRILSNFDYLVDNGKASFYSVEQEVTEETAGIKIYEDFEEVPACTEFTFCPN